MLSLGKDPIYTVGYGTVVLYLLSLTFFLLAAFYEKFFAAGIALGTLFLIIASIIIGIMVKMRINT